MEQQLYFIRNPKMSDRKAGRKPVFPKKGGKTRIVKQDDIGADRELIMPSAEQKLAARFESAQQRQREKMFRPALTQTERDLKKQLLDQTFVQQQQNKMEEDEAAAKLAARQAEESASRKSLMELPQLMDRVSQNHLLALQRVAPDIARELFGRLEPQRALQQEMPFSREESITVKEPTKREERKAQEDTRRREVLRKIIEDEGIERPVDIAKRYKEVTGSTRMFQGYIEMVKEIKRGKAEASDSDSDVKKQKGKFSIVDDSSESDTGSGLRLKKKKGGAMLIDGKVVPNSDSVRRKGLLPHSKDEMEKMRAMAHQEGAGFFSSLKDGVKNLVKAGVEKVADVVKENPIEAAKKALELGKQAREQYGKLFPKTKGGKLKLLKKHQKMIHKELKRQLMKKHKLSDEHAGGFADMFLSGLRAPFDAISKIPILKDIPIIKQATQIIPGVADAIGVKRVLI